MNIIQKYYDKVFTNYKKFIIIDIDQTLVDSSKRYRLAKDFNTAELLLDKIKDIPKIDVINRVKYYIEEKNYYPIFLTGRVRSKKTNEQLKELGFNNYFFIRNSKLYNPTLSSKFLKERVFLDLLEFVEKNNKRDIKLIVVEDRPDIIISILNILKVNQIKYEKEKFDNVFFVKINNFNNKIILKFNNNNSLKSR